MEGDQMKIVPETLRKLRKDKGLSQQRLADLARVDKKTIARIEGGRGGEARESTVTDVARVLGVNPLVLAEGPESEAMGDEDFRKHGYRRASLHLRGETILAYDLVRDRYGVEMWDVIDAAPFLFTLLAERSLLERRRRHEEMNAAWRAYWTTVPEHLRASIADHEAGSQVEHELIEKRDLFGRHIPEAYDWWADNRDFDEDRNLFSDFLTALAKDLGPDNDAIDHEGIRTFGDDLPSGQIFAAYRERLTGGSARADYALSHGYVRLTQIPEHLRSEHEDDDVAEDRVQWLEAQVPDDDWAEVQSRRPVLNLTTFTSPSETDESKKGEDNA